MPGKLIGRLYEEEQVLVDRLRDMTGWDKSVILQRCVRYLYLHRFDMSIPQMQALLNEEDFALIADAFDKSHKQNLPPLRDAAAKLLLAEPSKKNARPKKKT